LFIQVSQKKLKTAEFDSNEVLFTSIIRVGQYQNITGTIPVHIMILMVATNFALANSLSSSYITFRLAKQ